MNEKADLDSSYIRYQDKDGINYGKQYGIIGCLLCLWQ